MQMTDLQFFSEGAAATDAAGAQAVQTQQMSAAQETAVEADTAEEHGPVAEADSDSPVQQEDPSAEAVDLQQLQRIAEGRMRMQDWQAQGEQLRAFYPSFSLQDEYNSNEEFAFLLRNGVSVRQAYEVTHLPQILTCAMQYAARKAAEKTASAARTQQSRPQENGLSDRKAVLPTEKGVEKLTQTDIIRILERVGKGDKITF